MKTGRSVLLATAAMAGLVAMAGPALAQAAGQTTSGGDEAQALTEIVVTANKRQERLQDVPVSVTAVTSGVLERQNVREMGDLTKLVPGLTISYGSQPANFSINMRGIGTFSNGIAVESDVAVVIDDVPYGFQAAAFTDLVDVERVEALRGPQSTLFGKSAIAGVLNVVTQAPTERLSGKVTALVTDDHEWRLGGTVSGPISDTLLFRLTASTSDFRGTLRNLNGGGLNGTGAKTLSSKLVWRPNDALEVTVAPRYSRSDSNCCVQAIRMLTAANSGELYYQKVPQLALSSVLKGVTPSTFNDSVRMDKRAGGVSTLKGATFKTTYDLGEDSPIGDATLQYIGSYNDWRMNDYQDVDGIAAPVLMSFPISAPLGLNRGVEVNGRFSARSFTQELRLASPGGKRLNYVVGLWYADNDLTRYLDRGPAIATARYDSTSSNRTIATFAQGDLKLSEALSVLAGLRIQNQRIGYHFTKFDPATNFATSTTWARSDSESTTTGKIGLQYRVTPDFMAFATYSTGYKGQAYDLVSSFNSTVAANMPVPSETAKNREVGFKSSYFDKRMVLNVTAFQAEYRGFQVSNTSVLLDGTFLTALASVGQLRSRGIEGDVLVRPNSNLNLVGAFAYTEAEVREYPNGPCYPGQTAAQGCRSIISPSGASASVQNLAGKPLSNTPKFKFNIGGEYAFGEASAAVRPFVGFNYRWQKALNYSLNQDPATLQPAYGILDLQAGMTLAQSDIKVTAFLNNAFNKHYAAGISNGNFGFFDGAGAGATGRGWTPARDSFRYAGLRLDAKF